jgi:phosphate/sulfate permease
MTVSSVLFPILAWAPAMKGMKAEEAPPAIYKVILPLLLFCVLATVVAITVMTILNLLKKRVPMEDPDEPELGKLGSGEMTKYEKESKIAPGYGKVAAVLFIAGLVAFMFGGLYTMGRGSGTTEQLRKEGREKQARLKKRRQAAQAGGAAVGDEAGDTGGDEFGGMLGGGMEE